MKLNNNTPMEAFYGISGGGSADCGNIPANDSTDLPFYDNQQSVVVTFTAVGTTPPPPNETTPFSVTIPKSGTGTTVTIGLFQE